MPTINSFIRFLNASPGSPAVDIYFDGELVFDNIVYNELSNYLVVGPKEIHVQVFPTGEEGSPLLDTQLSIPASSTITAAIIGTMPNIGLMPIFFSAEVTQDSNALIRFVHLSLTAPAMDLAQADGRVLFTDVQYTQLTDFEKLTPGLYELQLQETGGGQVCATDELKAAERKAYTVYATGNWEGEPALDIFYYQDQIPYFDDLTAKTEFRKDTAYVKRVPTIIIRYK